MSFGLEGLEDAFSSQEYSNLTGERNVVMTSDTVDTPPKPLQRTAPRYPTRARTKGIEGYVTLSLLIDEMGEVKDIVIVDSYPNGTFEDSAKMTVESWVFQPGEYDGAPVSVRVTQTLRYSLG